VHSTTNKAPYKVVFQSKPHFKNWLTVKEQRTAPRVPCDGGGYITEADGIVVNGQSTKIALSRAALEASTSDKVVVSCKCRASATRSVVGVSKSKKSALFTATTVMRITIVGF
jgi:hypothetical protein